MARLGQNLALEFHRRRLEDPTRTALVVDGVTHDYGELARRAGAVAAWLRRGAESKADLSVAILGGRSLTSIAGILGAAWAGATYVPLSPKAPEDRLASVLDRAPVDALIVDERGASCLGERLRPHLPEKILSTLDALDGVPPLVEPIAVPGDTPAYLLFTSGTTGIPKAVVVTIDNVAAYLRGLTSLYRFGPDDRFSQFAELNFDFSVHEMFVSWGAGASLWVVPETQRLVLHEFIRDSKITVWSSVPSVVSLLQRLKVLRAGMFPSVRLTLFSGDALPAVTAAAWHEAAPSTIIDNHFGATELSVMCTHARWVPGSSGDERGMVPIGVPYPEMRMAVVRPDGTFAPPGEPGELAFAGPQITVGYRGDPELTAHRYPTKTHPVYGEMRWYLTGDLGIEDPGGGFRHLGRTDNQVKVRGYRIELEDVESHLREVSGCELVSVVAWPLSDGTASGLVAFVPKTAKLADEALKEKLATRLPAYMVPKTIQRLDEVPLTVNGKVDRKQLRAWLEAATRS